jgi:predicted amidophosphoribosyltransferase
MAILLLLFLISFGVLVTVAAFVLTVVFVFRKRNNLDIPVSRNVCPRCGGPLSKDSLGGLCPRCLPEDGRAE